MKTPPLLPQDLAEAREQELKAWNRRGMVMCALVWPLIAVAIVSLLYVFEDAFKMAQDEPSAWLVLALTLTVLALGFFLVILAPLEHRSGNLRDTERFWQALGNNPVDCQTMVDTIAQSASARAYRDNVVAHRELHRCDLLYAQHLAWLEFREAELEEERRICQQAHGLTSV